MTDPNTISGYKTSRNYARLWELAQEQSVICIAECRPGWGLCLRDVCQTHRNDEGTFINSRGAWYVFACDSKEEFVKYCEIKNIEFLEPTR